MCRFFSGWPHKQHTRAAYAKAHLASQSGFLIQLHDAELSAKELAAQVPIKFRENEELRELMKLKEQEVDRERADVSETEESRDQFLEQAALVS